MSNLLKSLDWMQLIQTIWTVVANKKSFFIIRLFNK